MDRVIGSPDGEYLQVLLNSNRPSSVSLKDGTPITFNSFWASFTDYRGRRWDIPMSNIAGIVHKKVSR
jgi:hypothetical protein